MAGQRPAAPKANVPSGSSFFRPHLHKLAPYKPIEPFDVLSARLGRPAHDIVKLDANENPYGPPPEARQALAQLEYPNIYPDPESRELRAGLAKWHGVPEELLLVSRLFSAEMNAGGDWGAHHACTRRH